MRGKRAFLTGIGMGVGLMYVLDPTDGRGRRARLTGRLRSGTRAWLAGASLIGRAAAGRAVLALVEAAQRRYELYGTVPAARPARAEVAQPTAAPRAAGRTRAQAEDVELVAGSAPARGGGQMRCEDLMTAEVVVVGTGEKVRDAARKMREFNIGFIPVCNSDGSVVGTITDRDIALRVVAEDRPTTTAVQDVMSVDIVACRPEDSVRRAEELMRVNQKNRILVIDDGGALVGVISMTDLAHYEDPRRVGELASDITDREVGVH
jgi:CBS domain-containing protein